MTKKSGDETFTMQSSMFWFKIFPYQNSNYCYGMVARE